MSKLFLDLDLFQEVHIDLPVYVEAESWLHGAGAPNHVIDVRPYDIDAEELHIYYYTATGGTPLTIIMISGASQSAEPIVLFGHAPLGYILAERLLSNNPTWQDEDEKVEASRANEQLGASNANEQLGAFEITVKYVIAAYSEEGAREQALEFTGTIQAQPGDGPYLTDMKIVKVDDDFEHFEEKYLEED